MKKMLATVTTALLAGTTLADLVQYESVISNSAPVLWYKNATTISNSLHVLNSGSAGSTYYAKDLGKQTYTDAFANENMAFGIGDTATQSASVNSSSGLFLTGQTGTISMLFKTPTTITQGAASLVYQSGFELLIASNKTLRLTAGGANSDLQTNMKMDTWYYIATSWNADQGATADELTWYLGEVGGTLTSGNVNLPGTTTGATGILYLAGRNGYYEYYAPMQQIATWGSELTGTDIQAQFAAIPEPATVGLFGMAAFAVLFVRRMITR